MRKPVALTRGFQQLFVFTNATQGEFPIGGLYVDEGGNIFGVTQYDGANYCGTLFELAPTDGGYSETVLHSFSSAVDGCQPYGAPVRDPATGDLFVTTSQGGPQQFGTALQFTPSGGGYTESAIYSFLQSSGGRPIGRMALTGSEAYVLGFYYGESNMGSLIGLTKSALKQNLVYQFTGPNGSFPDGGLVADSQGAIYGTTSEGGSANEGIVFKFTPNQSGGSESILWNFGATPGDGTGPVSDPLLIDHSGTIYGTTIEGGTYNLGTVFKLTPSGSTYSETILHSFGGSYDGSLPRGGVVLVGNELWGTTIDGGGKPCACGTIFSVSTRGTHYRRRLSFQGVRNGSQPYAGLFWDGQALYGTTLVGGSPSNGGTVFRYVP